MNRPLLLALSIVATGCSSAPVVPDAAANDASSGDSNVAFDAGSGDTGTTDDVGIDAASATDASGTTDAGSSLYTGSFVADSCGPADGPAIQITLYGAPGPSCGAADGSPSLTFYIHDLGGAMLPPRAGDTIASTAAESDGTANECPGGTPPCRVSEDWSVTFDSYAPGGGASGQYAITWGDGTTSSGSFDATRCTIGSICG